ncbi:dityrosine transporter [Fusarium coicis]|nr:dityrosine transporter [Fusarium coicis]
MRKAATVTQLHSLDLTLPVQHKRSIFSMNSLRRKDQCNSKFKEFTTEDQKKIMQYVQLQLQFCASITRLYSISNPEELSAFIQHTFSFMSNVILPDQKVLREIIDLNFVPLEMPLKPVPIDLDEAGVGGSSRSTSIDRMALVVGTLAFRHKRTCSYTTGNGKGTKRAREDDSDE